MKKLVVVFIVLAALVYGALSFHFIITDNGIKILRKAGLTLEYTFVDARGLKAHRLLTNPALVKAGIKDAIK